MSKETKICNVVKNGQKNARREDMIKLGIYNIHKNRTFKTKKQYTRREKHKLIS